MGLARSDELNNTFGWAVSLKLATGGSWEDAFVQPLQHPPRAALMREVDRWLTNAGDDVAVEVGFVTGAFVGLRFRPTERSRARELLHALLFDLSAEFARHSCLLVRQVLAVIDNAGKPRFAGQSPVHAEVGVLDRWHSLRAVNLGPPPWPAVADAVAQQPGGPELLTAALPAPLMLEVAYAPRGDGWVAAPVSRLDPGHHHERHYANPDSLDRVASLLSTVGQPARGRRPGRQ